MIINRLLSNKESRSLVSHPSEAVSLSHGIRLTRAFAPALCLSAFLVVGCVREKTVAGHRPGDRVEFGVSTGYDNPPETKAPEGMTTSAVGDDMAGNGADGSVGSPETVAEGGGLPETRTAYSGQDFTVGGSKWERIDWVDGDLFTVYCSAAQGTLKKSDYRVLSHMSNNQTSLASIEPAAGNGLQWGTGEHVFYAMYPAAGTPGVDASKVSLSGNVMRGTIPAVQTVTLKSGTRTYLPDMRYAYLYAATTVPSTGVPGPVNLQFKPMMTALEFTVDSRDSASLKLYRFELTSSAVALAGDFTATVTAATGEGAWCTYAVPPHSASTSTIAVDFGGYSNPTIITKGQPITFTVFALPQTLRGLKAKFFTSRSTETMSLSYSGGTPVNFVSCRKSRVGGIRVPQRPHYTDQEGRDFGLGIKLAGIVWAPVNCGTDTIAPNPGDHPWGLMYQWGRAYGHGHGYEGAGESNAPVLAAGWTDTPAANTFYFGNSTSSLESHDWKATRDDYLWNAGTEANPVKTANDPCPEGWRVPTNSELIRLNASFYSWNAATRCGEFTDGTSTLILPAGGNRYAGTISYYNGQVISYGTVGYYISSSYLEGERRWCCGIFFSAMGQRGWADARARGNLLRCVAE